MIFEPTSDMLVIDRRTCVELSAAAYPAFDIAASAISVRFRYSDDGWTDLALLWQVEGTRQFLADSHAMVMVMDDHDVRCLRVA